MPRLLPHGYPASLRAATLAICGAFVFSSVVWVLDDYGSTPLLAALADPWQGLSAASSAPPSLR
ncbi:MAG: hypothetical protein ACK5RK_08470 [Betaproteobacteria bacterium]